MGITPVEDIVVLVRTPFWTSVDSIPDTSLEDVVRELFPYIVKPRLSPHNILHNIDLFGDYAEQRVAWLEERGYGRSGLSVSFSSSKNENTYTIQRNSTYVRLKGKYWFREPAPAVEFKLTWG